MVSNDTLTALRTLSASQELGQPQAVARTVQVLIQCGVAMREQVPLLIAELEALRARVAELERSGAAIEAASAAYLKERGYQVVGRAEAGALGATPLVAGPEPQEIPSVSELLQSVRKPRDAVAQHPGA